MANPTFLVQVYLKGHHSLKKSSLEIILMRYLMIKMEKFKFLYIDLQPFSTAMEKM